MSNTTKTLEIKLLDRELRVACPEEIALRLGYITLDQFEKLAERCAKSSYGEYLMSIHRTFVESRRAEF